MDDARALRGFGASPKRPGSRLLVARGEKGPATDRVKERPSHAGQRPLTEPEPLDPVLYRTGRGEHQHPALTSPGGQGAADLVAVGAGEIPVQHHHVVTAGPQASQGVVAVQRHVDDHPVAAQPRRHGPGQPLVIFCYQHPHGHKMPRRRSQPGHNCD